MHWSAKKLLDLYYILRGDRTPREAVGPDGQAILPDMEVEEERLRAAKIDGREFEYFYGIYSGRIYRFLYNRTLRQDVAEDLTSQTFLKAYENLDRYRWTGVRIGSWLYRIAKNELIKWIEDRKKRNAVPLPENVYGEDLLQDPALGPEDRLLAAQERARLTTYLSRLDPEDQVWIQLRVQEELSTERIAEIAGRPWGTVASRISRAMKKLERMAEEDDARRE